MPGTADEHADVLSAPGAAARSARGTGLRLLAYLASTALSVVTAAALLRYLGVAEYGRYATVFALVTIVGGVCEAGTANVGVRELAVRPPAEHRALLADLQGVRLALTLAGGVLALVFVLVAGYPASMVDGALLAVAGLLLIVLAITPWVTLQASLQLERVAVLELARQVLTVLVVLALVAAGASLAVLLGAQVPVALGLVAAGAVVLRRAPLVVPAFHPARWRVLLRATLPYAAATALGLVYSSSVLLVMSLVASETETGLYGAASRIFVVLAGIAGIVVGSVFPILARAGRDDRARMQMGVQRLFDLMWIGGLGLALVTAAGAPVAIDIVAGDDFDRAEPVLRILALALPASFLLALGAFALLSVGRQAALIAVNGTGLAIGVALALVLGDDAQGGAIATLVGESAIAVLSFVALARAGIVPSPRALPKVALAAGLGAAAAFGPGLPALPAAVLGGGVLVGAAFALGLVPELRRS